MNIQWVKEEIKIEIRKYRDKNKTYQNLMACIKSSTKKEVIVSTLKKIMNKQRTFIPQGTKTNLVEGRKQKRLEQI